MNTNNILPKKFHEFIEKLNFHAPSDFHYFRHQIILPEIIFVKILEEKIKNFVNKYDLTINID